MDLELRDTLAAQLLALADDELILGHRDSEWCGHAPILEEDITFANMALDEISHAITWYSLLAGLLEKDQEGYSRQLVYHRDAPNYRCIPFVELPKGDWAFSMLRQYLFDVAEKLRLETMMNSAYQPLSQAASKMAKEEVYHLRYTQAWVHRLGSSTTDSHRRMQAALDHLWPLALEQFTPLPGEATLIEAGYMAGVAQIGEKWLAVVVSHLQASGLTIPENTSTAGMGREQHSDHLSLLIRDLQQMAHPYL
jgi:ring-1,2-phenylacetyl-CoA epoxidase subunit PaaC